MSYEQLISLGAFPELGWMSKWTYDIARALSRLLVMVKWLHVFSNYMDKNDLSHAHDETGIVPIIFNVLLIKRKQGTLICFDIALTLSGKFAEKFPQWYSHKLSSACKNKILKVFFITFQKCFKVIFPSHTNMVFWWAIHKIWNYIQTFKNAFLVSFRSPFQFT